MKNIKRKENGEKEERASKIEKLRRKQRLKTQLRANKSKEKEGMVSIVDENNEK